MAKQAEKENSKVTTATAHVRYIRMSPRKVRLVTNLVKNMWADEAVVQLRFTNKKAAKVVADLIQSAMANGANNFNLKKESLFIKTITCDSGPALRRFMPRAQGRATPIRKPTSHIHVLLEEKEAKRKKTFGIDEKKKKEFKEKLEKAESKADKEGIKAVKNELPETRGQVEKTDRQIKENKVQNKRRLFNRKSGV